jgi:hypothetical protein
MSDALARAYGWTWLALAVLGLLGGTFGLVLVTLPALVVGAIALLAPRAVTVEALAVAAFFGLAEWRYAQRAEGLVRDYGSALHNHAFPHAALVLALLNLGVATALVVSGLRARR